MVLCIFSVRMILCGPRLLRKRKWKVRVNYESSLERISVGSETASSALSRESWHSIDGAWVVESNTRTIRGRVACNFAHCFAVKGRGGAS